MSARRQPSTTSLSKFAHANAPAVTNRSYDFCNAFWGIGDGGVEVLFARMRGATRTVEELKNFWKERASIEEDYAKRLTKLAKTTLGRDEIGELRNSLDTVRLETDKQAGYHMLLAKQLLTDIQSPAAAFYTKQVHHKKAYQAVIEKEYRAKQTHESYVNTAREKYEADCVRINSYTAQSTLVQGKDLEKIQSKLERAQQTVQANERDFASFAKVLQETTQKWEQNWKAFCDSSQDLEEDRMEFMKDNMWAYANAVSTVCVNDDESCEKMRLALEQIEPERDMENFVRDYGTGNLIPDPPAFVNYSAGDAPPLSSTRPTTHAAQFSRTSQRPPPNRAPPPEEEPTTNAAGVGAGGSRRIDQHQRDPSPHRAPTQTQATPRDQAHGSSVNGSTARQNSTRRPTKPPQDLNAEPIDPTADTYIKQGSSRAGGRSATAQQGPQGVDPLAEQMENLKNAVSGSGGLRKSGTWKHSDQRAGGSTSRKGTMDSTTGPGPSSLGLPSSSANPAAASQGQPQRDYRNSAEFVVGVHPSASRPSSPNPPTGTHSRSPPGSASSVDVESIVADYQASLPGERKSVSRPHSRQGSYSDVPPANSQPAQNRHVHNLSQGQNLATSSVGYVGVGAGRSSPHPISRSASPATGNRNNLGFQPSRPNAAGGGYGHPVQRNVSAGSVGIVLDPNGTVVEDTMADAYVRQHGNAPQYVNQTDRRTSYLSGNNAPPPITQQPPQPQQNYGANAPPPTGYQNIPAGADYVRQGYGRQPQSVPYTAPPPQNVYQQQPPHMGGYAPANPHMHPPQGVHGGYGGQFRPPSPAVEKPPSPLPPAPPTGQTTEEGVGILFYVKALYDYNATIDEEFDFQAGDIIAVTATPEDGWWSGELLDEARRRPGRHVFPSNFVCLF